MTKIQCKNTKEFEIPRILFLKIMESPEIFCLEIMESPQI